MKYIYSGDSPFVIKSIPKKWTLSTGGKTGNFDIMSNAIHNQEGWFPITVKNNETYDSDIQTRTLDPNDIIISGDHAEITYTLTNIALNIAKRDKGRQIIREGKAILAGKYEDEWEDGYDADKDTLKNYFINTIRPLIAAATTTQEVKDINSGDEYTYPTI